MAVISIASVGLGALLYRLLERPVMRWRERWVPSNFVDGQGQKVPTGASPVGVARAGITG